MTQQSIFLGFAIATFFLVVAVLAFPIWLVAAAAQRVRKLR